MKVSLKAGAVIVCILFAALMLPIVITCFYTYPVLDDFNFGARVHHAVLDGTNVLWAALQNAHSFYMNWQGAYTANFFAGIQPFVWNVRLYCLSNLFLLTWVSGIMLFFFYTLLCSAFHAPKPLWLMSTLLLLLLFWERIPSPTEGIFWMDGSLNIVHFSYVFLEIALMLRFFLTKGKKRWLLAVLCCLISVLIGGSNQSNVIALTMAGLAGLCFPQIRRDITGKMIVLAIAFAVGGMLVNSFAPGATNRISGMSGISIPKAVVMAVYYGFAFFAQWMGVARISILLILCVLLLPVLKKTSFAFPCPFIAVILCFGFYSCAISVTLFSKGEVGAERQLNYYFLSFTYSTAVMMIYLAGWLVKKYPKLAVLDGKTIPAGLILASVIMIASGMVGSGIHSLTSVDTAWGLYKGYTQKYAAEMQQRIDILENPEIRDAVLEPLSQTLNYLPREPQGTDPNVWTNLSVAAYFRKDSVRLTEKE